MRVVLAGLWARRGLAGATLLLAVLAVAFAMIGPTYARAAGEHLLDSRISEMTRSQTMLTAERLAMPDADVPAGPTAYHPPDPMGLAGEAAASMRTPGVDRYWEAPQTWLLDQGTTVRVIRDLSGRIQRLPTQRAILPLYWHLGMCRLAQIHGRCPVRADEALIDPDFARRMGLHVGGRVDVEATDEWRVATKEHTRTTSRSFVIVGTYRVPTPAAAWGDPTRFQGDPQVELNSPHTGVDAPVPRAPALLVAPSAMTGQTVHGGADRVIDLGAVDLATMHEAAAVGDRASAAYVHATGTEDTSSFDLDSAVATATDQRAALQRITLAAVAPLVALGLLLLHGLVSAGAEGRRQQVALAKLRGQGRARVLWFALTEPVTVVVAAVPAGVVVTWLVVRVLARAWLGAATPVRFDPTVWLAGGVVVAAALVAALAAVARVLREPLSASLGATGQATSSSRWALVGRSAVVVLAVATCAQVAATSGSRSGSGSGGGFLHLVAPVLIALAVAIVAGWLLRRLAAVWIARSARRSVTSTYLAARRLGRRRDLATLVVPLVLATSVAAFATSAWYVGDDWKVSRAATTVGAPRTYVATASPQRLLAATHQVDPHGRYLAAAVIASRGEGTVRQVLMDTSRLATVAAWDPSWSGTSVADLQRRLTVHGAVAPITFTGTRLTLGIADSRLTRTALGEAADLEVDYLDDAGDPQGAYFGAIPDRAGAGELTASVFHCRVRCTVQRIAVTGGGGAATTSQGALTLTSVAVDGRPADWHLDAPADWRPARPFPATPTDPPITVRSAGGGGLRLSVYLGHLPPDASGHAPASAAGIAAISPADVPDTLPALVAAGTRLEQMPTAGSGIGLSYPADVVAGNALDQSPTPLRPVATVAALPGLGRNGVLVDLAAALREPPPPRAILDVRLWAAADTPTALLDQVRAAGVALRGEQRESTALSALRADAFGLGWRIFLLVATLTVALALVGVYAGALTQRRWRSFETAALLSVLVRRRTLAVAAVLEHAAVVLLVCATGVVAAWLSLRLALPTIDLGQTSPTDPYPDFSVRWPVVGLIALTVFVLATLVASWVSLRTVRRQTATELPWDEQQL